jgi:hypothetical protein
MTQGIQRESKMESKAMRRAVRSARAVILGPEILKFIQDPKTRQRLIAAAESGAPPITAISGRLAKIVGARDVKLPPVKQFAGVCVRAVLEEAGFQVAAKGVRVSRDPVFRTGSTYERMVPTNKATFLARLVQCMNDEEAGEVLELLKRRRTEGK